MKVFKKGLILVGVPVLVEVVLIASLAFLLVKSDEAQIREQHSRRFSALSGKLITCAFEAPYSLIMYLQTRNEKAKKAYLRAREGLLYYSLKVNEEMPYMPEFKSSNKTGRKNIERLLSICDKVASADKAGGMLTFLGKAVDIKNEYETTKNETMEILADYRRIGDEVTRSSQRDLNEIRAWQTRILLFGFAANIIVGAILMLYFNRSIRSRLDSISQNTVRLGRDQDLLPELTGDDEIRQLDKAFHSMTAELRSASEKEKMMFNNASDVICVLDANNCFTKINPACMRLWGYEPAELIYESVDMILADDPQLLQREVDSARESKAPASFESKVKTRSGKILEVSWSAYWSQSEQSLFCVVHDISDRKNAERVKKQFLSMISSDLKVPLSAISASVALLLTGLSEGLSKMACEKLEMAKKNVQRLLGLVNDLLQLTELESGNLELHKQDCQVEELFRRSAQDVEALAGKMKVSIRIDCHTKQWHVDPDRIMQVIVNLLSNAVKFSPEGGEVTLWSETTSDGMIHVKIIDQGRGVPESHKSAIFEKFKQVSAADGKRKSGTGLGLPICKQIVEEHGGSIGVDSEEGKGSTFWFMVPRHGAAPVRPKAPARTAIGLRAVKPEAVSSQQTLTSPPRPLGRMRLQNKGFILIGLPILFEIAFVAMLSVLLIQGSEERQRELHARMIAVDINLVLSALFKEGTLMSSGVKEEWVWDEIKGAWEKSLVLRQELRELVKDDPEDLESFDEAEEAFAQQDLFWRRAVDIMDGPFDPKALEEVMKMRMAMLPLTAKAIHRVKPLIEIAEKKESVSPEIQKRIRQRQAQLLLAGMGINFIIAVLLAIFFSRDITKPLKVLADNADRLSREEELNPLIDGTDEIAQLDQVFHATALAVVESRHKERAVFDNSQDVICTLTADGDFASLNPACEGMWGYTQKELAGRSIMDLVFADDMEKTKSALLSDFGESQSKGLEHRMVRKSGAVVWVEWSLSRPEPDGPLFGVAHDITNRKELEQLKQDFLAVVSHDLRTPLTSISGVAKLMMAGAMGPLNDRVKDVLGGILRNGDKLLELINDILDIEKLEAGHMQLILENVGLEDVLQKTLDGTGANKRAAVEVSLPPSTLEIRADKDRLIQALSNVLNHALNSTSDSAPVQISVDNGPDCVEIRVVDSAPVLSEKARSQLFERFKEVTDGGGASERVGTGLALPIARKIVESHGGSIGVSAKGELGNMFWIRLPLESQPAAV